MAVLSTGCFIIQNFRMILCALNLLCVHYTQLVARGSDQLEKFKLPWSLRSFYPDDLRNLMLFLCYLCDEV